MSRTKIVATIGPASSNPDTLRRMLEAGMNVARVNFSHGDHDSHRATVQMLRQVATQENKVLAILGDLQGPKIRIGMVPEPGLTFREGDEVIFTANGETAGRVPLPHPDVVAAVKPGARIVVGDGELEFTVVRKVDEELYCTATYAGTLRSRKGINLPGTPLPISSITDKDKIDLKLICELQLDYVALSFVRSPNDIHELRELMAIEGANIPVIAKIEKSEALAVLDDILAVTDGMMVARGDLGIDVPPQEVPLLQKQMIRLCNAAGKPVITATQMLQSMVDVPRPTRAEASDVANAILDGTDAVMLSNETASGKYPVESVLMMRHIAEITEQQFPFDVWRQRRQESYQRGNITRAISGACCMVAEQVEASYIVSASMSGYTAMQIARHRPRTPIICVTPRPETQRLLALVWGVECVHMPSFKKRHKVLEKTIAAIQPLHVRPGQRIVITAGVPLGLSGSTNLIQVHEFTIDDMV